MPMPSDTESKTHYDRQRVFAEICQIVGESQKIEPSAIKESDALAADLQCDSLDIVELAMTFEEHFDISVSDEVVQQVLTIGDAVDVVLRELEAAGGSADVAASRR